MTLLRPDPVIEAYLAIDRKVEVIKNDFSTTRTPVDNFKMDYWKFLTEDYFPSRCLTLAIAKVDKLIASKSLSALFAKTLDPAPFVPDVHDKKLKKSVYKEIVDKYTKLTAFAESFARTDEKATSAYGEMYTQKMVTEADNRHNTAWINGAVSTERLDKDRAKALVQRL